MLGKLLSGWGCEVNNLDHFFNVIFYHFPQIWTHGLFGPKHFPYSIYGGGVANMRKFPSPASFGRCVWIKKIIK